MALSEAQLNDSVYLQNMIRNLRRQKEQSLRQNEMRKQQDLRLLRQTNARSGINGGFEESNYARLLARAGQGADSIYAQFDPQIAEYQGYYDAWKARQAAQAASGGGGGYRRRRTDNNGLDTSFTRSIGRGSVGNGYSNARTRNVNMIS